MPLTDPPPEPEQIEAEEVERLIALAEQGQLDAAAQRRVAPLLRTLACRRGPQVAHTLGPLAHIPTGPATSCVS